MKGPNRTRKCLFCDNDATDIIKIRSDVYSLCKACIKRFKGEFVERRKKDRRKTERQKGD